MDKHIDPLEAESAWLRQEIARLQGQEHELRRAYSALQAIVAASPMAIFTIDPEGYVQTWNPAAERIFGWSAGEAIGSLLPIVPPESQEEFRALREKVLHGEPFAGYETRRIRRDGTYIDVSITAAPMHDPAGRVTGIMSLLEDITERKQLREQYLHAQRLESIGRLAGGVAHDFNNLLTAILGYSELCALNLSSDDPIYGYVEQIRKAGERATSLTRQLLAFARRQIFEPRVINLNDLTLEMDKLLRRVLGEDIELVTVLAPDLLSVRADPGQMEQVLLNLAVNARDAMPLGGRLTIETANVVLDAAYARGHAEVAPGPYVMVAVTDTGIGMSREVMEHIFEPFFTTKSEKGTGLGLATCHGIVKQSGGHIWVYSEPGRGTTFKVYLPSEQKTPETISRTINQSVRGGTETILVLEDDPLVSGMAVQALVEQGYKVLASRTGDEALRIAREYAGEIRLLLTDVVLPRLSGRQVAEQLQEQYPNLRVLYMSGYAENSVVHHGILDPGIAFLAKPFTPSTLVHKVREVLDSGS